MNDDRPPPPPGWYPHNALRDKEQYWDGNAWTGQLRKKQKRKPAGSKPGAAASPARAQDPKNRGIVGRAMKAADERVEAQKKIVCQFCQEPGGVTVRHFKKDKRLSATRLLGGMVTMGASVAVVGVTKKGHVTRLTCDNCKMTWDLQG